MSLTHKIHGHHLSGPWPRIRAEGGVSARFSQARAAVHAHLATFYRHATATPRE